MSLTASQTRERAPLHAAVHPRQPTRQCSRCGADVGVYPSGQAALARDKELKILCHVCVLAPGALREPSESIDNPGIRQALMRKVKERPDWGPSWRGKKHPCLDCGSLNDAATGAEPGMKGKPNPGDIALCLYCGHLMAYADDGESFRQLTDQEMVEIAGDPVIIAAQRARKRAGIAR